MKILLATAPDGPLSRTQEKSSYVWMPHGVLRVATYVERNGFSTDIYDINTLRGTDEEIKKKFKKVKPDIVGLGGSLSHCYPNIKRISRILRETFPNVWIITGGAITASANVILAKTETDICVIGDGEIPFFKLLNYFKSNSSRKKINFEELKNIKGLAYIDEKNKLKVTDNGDPLSANDASEIHYPNYDKIRESLEIFSGQGELVHDFFWEINDLKSITAGYLEQQLYPEGLDFFNKNKNKKIAEIRSTQGCVARCTFCQRYIKGYRVYNPLDMETHIINIKEKYNIAGLVLNDENSLSDRKRSYEMAKIFKKYNMYWTAGGVRVKSVTYEDLKFYKEHNLLSIRFGIESGSQKILDIMEKKIKLDDVYKTLSACKKLGISVATDMFMLGMPGETSKTVLETAKMSGELRYMVGKDWNIGNTPLAMAIPGTPLYEYCQQIGVIGKSIEEEEDYLVRTSEFSNKDILTYVNKTDSSIEEVHYWTYLYRYAAKKNYVKEIFKSKNTFITKLKEYYKKCLIASFEKIDIYFEKKEKNLVNKLRKLNLYFYQFIITIGITFLPKIILFSILKTYAYYDFTQVRKKHMEKERKQKHNCFVELRDEKSDKFRIGLSRLANQNKQIDLSLRKIVAENRVQIKPSMSEEEKSLHILAQGQ